MTEPVVYHALLTRFNIRSSGVGYKRDQDPKWLEQRFALFDQFCVPSVVTQTQERFEWLIFCDSETAPQVLERLQAVDPRVRTVLVQPAANPPELKLHHYVPAGTDVVISTRLDNDDALNRHALRRVREHVEMFTSTGHKRWLYNPALGFKLDVAAGQLYEAEHKSNPFLSLFELATDDEPPVGAHAGSHVHMHTLYPTFQDTGSRLWLQVVHGGNVSNCIRRRDTAVSIAALGEDFVTQLGKFYRDNSCV